MTNSLGRKSAIIFFKLPPLPVISLFALSLTGCYTVLGDDIAGLNTEDLAENMDDILDEIVEAGFLASNISTDDALIAVRKIVLTNKINERSTQDVISRLVYLDRIAPGVPIDLYIVSQGGFAHAAFAIVDAIELVESPVNVYALGRASSSAAIILAAGSGRRFVGRYSYVRVRVNLYEKAETDYEKIYNRRFVTFWKEHANLPSDWYPMLRNVDYYLTPEQAVEYGIADEVIDPNNR